MIRKSLPLVALAALARAGVDTVVLRETDVSETARPARKDVTVTYTDTAVALPAGAPFGPHAAPPRP